MSRKTTLSACLIVKDEESLLPECLGSLQPVVDEIIVVDTGSTDKTREIVRACGAKLIEHPWQDDFSEARNVGLEAAQGDWILVIDADERLIWDGYAEFREPLQDPEKWGYLVTVVNQREEEDCPVLLLRLFRNDPAIRYTGIVHERVDPAIVEKTGDFNRAVGLHSCRIQHSGYLAQRLLDKNKSERDIRLLKKQIEKDPSDPYHWFKFAVNPHIRQSLAEEARQALEESWTLLTRQDPQGTIFGYTPEVAALHILECLGHKEVDRAVRVARMAEVFPPVSPNLLYALGVSALYSGDRGKAASFLEKALSFKDKRLAYAPAEGVVGHLSLNALSELKYLEGNRDGSLKLYLEACNATRQPLANAFHGEADSLVVDGNAALAFRLIEQAVRDDPADAHAWAQGGEILLHLGMHDKAVAWLNVGKNQASPSPRLNMLLSKAHEKLSCP